MAPSCKLGVYPTGGNPRFLAETDATMCPFKTLVAAIEELQSIPEALNASLDGTKMVRSRWASNVCDKPLHSTKLQKELRPRAAAVSDSNSGTVKRLFLRIS